MWIRTLDLDKALRTDPLIAAPSPVTKDRIVDEADGTFEGLLVQENLDTLSVDVRILGQLYLRGIYGFVGLL